MLAAQSTGVQLNAPTVVARPRALALELRDYLALLKLRMVGLLVFTAAIAALAASHGAIAIDRLALLALVGGLASAGSCALNHYFERDLDAAMARTRGRPLAAGRLKSPRVALALGLGLIALGLLLSPQLNYAVGAYTLLGAFIYVVVYTLWLKRRSSLNVVVGGLAGGCAVLAGWSAARPEPSLAALFMAAIVFFWSPAHFWSFAIAHREKYAKAGVPMLPVSAGEAPAAWRVLLHSGLTYLASLLLIPFGPFGLHYAHAATLWGALFLIVNALLVLYPSKEMARQSYKFSGLYLGVLFIIMYVDILVHTY